MGSTIEDIYQEEFEEAGFKRVEINSNFENIVSERVIDDEAWKVFNYLPINKTNTLEVDYQNHLWSSFIHLDGGSEQSRQFAIMPFHLLFMLCLQYKVLRIYKHNKEKYDLAFIMEHPDDKDKAVLCPNSVFTLGALGESKLVDIFRIVGVDNGLIGEVKSMVRYRNDNIAHAKGGMTFDLDDRISNYLKYLDRIQKKFLIINNEVAEKWKSETGEDQEGVEYIETHLAEEYLCPADMWGGKMAKLEDRLNGRK